MRIVIILSLWPAPRKVLVPETPDRGPPFIKFYVPKPLITAPLHKGLPQLRTDNAAETSDDVSKPREPPPPGQYTSPQFRMQFPYPSFNFLTYIVEILRFSLHCRFV